MKTRIFFSIISLLFLLENVFSQKIEMGKPFFRYYSPKETKIPTQVWNITQDKRGIVYIAGSSVVWEYDGANFREIKLKNNENLVRSLDVDENGVVYVGCVGDVGCLYPDKNGNLQYFSFVSSIDSANRSFTDVWETRVFKNNVYFRSRKYLFQFSQITSESMLHKKIPYKIFLPNDKRTFAKIEMINDTIFVQTGKKFFILKHDSMYFHSQNEKFSVSFSAILPYDSKRILCNYMRGGLTFFEPSLQVFHSFSSPVNTFLEKNFSYHGISFDNNNQYAFATFTNGVVFCDKKGEITQTVNRAVVPDLESAWYLAKREEQSVWCGTDKGMLNIDISSPFRFWDIASGLRGSVQSIIRFKNILYVATLVGVFYLDTVSQNFEPNKFIEVKNLKNQVWDMLIFKNKLIVACTNGIFEILDGKAVLIKKGISMKLLFRAKYPNSIFYSTRTTFEKLDYENEKWKIVPNLVKLNKEVRSMIEDDDGNIWAGSLYNGIFRLSEVSKDSFSVAYFDTAQGLPFSAGNRVYSVENKVLAGTQRGFYSFNKQKQRFEPNFRFGKKFYNDSISIFRFIRDKNGNFFASSDSRIKKFNREKDNSYSIDSLIFKRLPKSLFYAIFSDSNDVFWFGSRDGLFRYDSKIKVDVLKKTFNVLIRKVLIRKDSILFGGNAFKMRDSLRILSNEKDIFCEKRISYLYNSLIFEFAAPFFEDESATEYSYFLENFDKNWSDWTKETKKEYTNLSEGKYCFKVKARNIYGIESSEVSYHFAVAPPWYRTIFAYFCYVLLILGAFYLGIKLYSKRLERKNRELEEIVAERTSEIREQNAELSQFNAEIMQQKEEIQTQMDQLAEFNAEIMQQKEEIQMQAEELQSVNDQLSFQNEKIEMQNHQIMSGIRYALTIQNAILPNIEEMQQFFEIFVMYYPKNIVSGDFYWFSDLGNENISLFENAKNVFLFAVGDCTGHGVPGAFMSMIANRLLSEIVNERKIFSPKDILENLHGGIVKSLQQKYSENNDGMDIGLCLIAELEKNYSVIFAGAKNSLFIYRGETENIEIIKASRRSIGGFRENKNLLEFENQILSLNKNDILYLTTDGFIDQNNIERKRFGTQKFVETLKKYSHLPMLEQWICLENELAIFQGNEEQRDDITVLGIKL